MTLVANNTDGLSLPIISITHRGATYNGDPCNDTNYLPVFIHVLTDVLITQQHLFFSILRCIYNYMSSLTMIDTEFLFLIIAL